MRGWKRAPGQIRKDLKMGMTIGASAAFLMMIWALVGYLGSGATNWHSTFPGVSFPWLEAAYAALGVGAGALVGALRPVGRHWWGAALLGAMVSVLCYGTVGGIDLLLYPPFLVMAIVAGAAVGILLWNRHRDGFPRQPSVDH